MFKKISGKKILVVIPSDPISAYINQGLTSQWLESYYNPKKYFDKVYLLSPMEEDRENFCGMTVVHSTTETFEKDLKRLQVDIVRAYGGNWTADLACLHKVMGIPVIVSIHDKKESYCNGPIGKADYLFCVSEVVRKMALKRFSNPDRVWLLPNRVDFNVMKPIEQVKREILKQKYPFRYNILHVGRISKEKNLESVIRALPILGKEYGLIAVGSGNEKPFLDLAKEMNVSDQLFFIHHVDNHELPKYYSFCDCMCTPSLSEGFGIVFIEAIACEAVVVTSDIAPMNEYIKNKENGLLVKNYTDPESLAKKIEIACKDENIRKKIKSNTRASIEKFSKEKIDDLEVDYYSKILNESK